MKDFKVTGYRRGKGVCGGVVPGWEFEGYDNSEENIAQNLIGSTIRGCGADKVVVKSGDKKWVVELDERR